MSLGFIPTSQGPVEDEGQDAGRHLTKSDIRVFQAVNFIMEQTLHDEPLKGITLHWNLPKDHRKRIPPRLLRRNTCQCLARALFEH